MRNNKYTPSHKYGIGSFLKTEKGAGPMAAVQGAVGVADLTKDMLGNINYDTDATAYENMLKDVNNEQFGGTIDDLLAQSREIDRVNFGNNFKDNLGYLDSSDVAGTVLGGVGKGAAAGASIGSVFPGYGTVIGAGIGAVVGGLSSGIGAYSRNQNVNAEARRLQNEAKVAEQNRINKLNSAVDTTNAVNAQFAKKNAMNMFDAGGLMTNGSMFNTEDYNSVDAGGSHEANPYDGVQMGIAPDGLPNLVEQGEKIVNINGDKYVFSKRFKINNPEKYNLPKQLKGKTFADASEYLFVKSGMEESPNNPINKDGNDILQERLMTAQEDYKAKKQQREAAKAIDNMSDEDKMNMLLALQQQGEQPMMAAEGGFLGGHKHDDGGLNKILTRPSDLQTEPFTLESPITISPFLTTAFDVDKLETPSTISPTDDIKPIDINDSSYSPYKPPFRWWGPTATSGVAPNLLTKDQVEFLDKKMPPQRNKNLTVDEAINKAYDRETSTIGNTDNPLPTYPRYSPAIQSWMNVIGDMFGITNRPDYSNVDLIERSIKQPRMLGYSPVGMYQTYTHTDDNYLLNRQAQIGNSTANAIKNLVGGNRQAAIADLLARNYNTQLNQGNVRMSTAATNRKERNDVIAANNQLDMKNAERADAISKANQAAQQTYDNMLLNARIREAQMRENILSDSETAKNNNWTSLAQNLGLIGNENMQWNWLQKLIDAGYFTKI